jgi:diketogulonate reductase-like aldo/keto reductase
MHNSGRDNSKAAIRASLKECGLEYIDLYLIHSPIGGPQMRKESWEACVEAQREGLVKSIGVSNFGVGHLNEMLQYGLPLPSVNQVCQTLFNFIEPTYILL